MPAVQVHVPGSQLADLAKAAAHTEFGHGHLAQVLEHGPDEVAHFDQGDFRQRVDLAHAVFAGIACARGDMSVAIGVGHIETLVDGGDVRRTGERPHDTTGAENRQAAEDAQARVHGFQRQPCAIANVDGNFEPACVAHRFCQAP